MNNNRRYSLVSEYNGLKTVIKLDEFDSKSKKQVKRDKVSLATIDMFTSGFDSLKECNDYLCLNSNSKLNIYYQSDKKTKRLPCIYSSNQLIRYFAEMYKNNDAIDIKDKYFREFINKFFILICRMTIRQNIMCDPIINKYIKDKILDYLQFDTDEYFTLNKIESELTNYKNLRSIILNINNYELQTDNKVLDVKVPVDDDFILEPTFEISRFIPNDDLEEPLFPPNSEEEQRYVAYLENLPIEYDCHEYPRLTKKR